MDEITLRDFQRLMLKRKRSVDDLIDIFRGKLDDSRSFFERVMTCQWRNPDTARYDPRSDVVIPYRSVIEFYRKEAFYLQDTRKNHGRRKITSWRPDFIEEFCVVLTEWLPYPSTKRRMAKFNADLPATELF
jgi:hypothetical protein